MVTRRSRAILYTLEGHEENSHYVVQAAQPRAEQDVRRRWQVVGRCNWLLNLDLHKIGSLSRNVESAREKGRPEAPLPDPALLPIGASATVPSVISMQGVFTIEHMDANQ